MNAILLHPASILAFCIAVVIVVAYGRGAFDDDDENGAA